MVNVALLWYLLLPIVLSTISIFVLRKWVPRFTWGQAIGAAAIGLVISAGITSAFFFIGKGSRISDTEILNGEVLNKDRKHGSYVRSYQCRCRTSYSGSGKNRTSHTTCDTCYEDHYTVKWTCYTNIGNFTIESLDRTSRSVYNTPDPARYTSIKPGDPASRTHDYTNYIKAVPETLFRPASKSLREQFAGKIPKYPDKIYDFYRINRVVTDGTFLLQDIDLWNAYLSEALKKLGPQKQANAVIVITKSASTDYFYALQDAWLNGKKNDVILVIGAPEYPKIAWVRVMALTTDQIFQVKLRDSILDLKTIVPHRVVGTLAAEIRATFKRKSMKDFKYLDAEIDPPFWVMMWCMILNILAYVGFWVYAYSHRDYNSYNRFGAPRFRY